MQKKYWLWQYWKYWNLICCWIFSCESSTFIKVFIVPLSILTLFNYYIKTFYHIFFNNYQMCLHLIIVKKKLIFFYHRFLIARFSVRIAGRNLLDFFQKLLLKPDRFSIFLSELRNNIWLNKVCIGNGGYKAHYLRQWLLP